MLRKLSRIVFLVRSLPAHGAERQLLELVRHLDRSRFLPVVTTFYSDGDLFPEMHRIPGTTLSSMEKKGRWDLIGFMGRVLHMAWELKPDVIYSFAAEPNLVALLLGRAAKAKVMWGIRRSTQELPRGDRVAMASFRLGAHLSNWPDKIVYNSYCGRDLYTRRGYCDRNSAVIPNGFDTKVFRPDMEARDRQRKIWGVANSEFLIGIVGRLHPVKGHRMFLQTAASVIQTHPTTRFVCIGEDSNGCGESLERYTKDLSVSEKVLWTGACSDMVSAYNALDVLALCSKEEGCPNAVGEAMACGVPCVVADVGDAAMLVGDTGLIVPPGDVPAMIKAWRTMLGKTMEERLHQGMSGRRRIETEYGVETMARRTEAILDCLLR